MQKKGKRDYMPHLPFQDKTIENVIFPEERLLTKNMLFSGEHHKPNLILLRQHLLRQGKLTEEAAICLIRKAKQIFRKEKNVLTIYSPVTIFGDIHGQFYDLVNVLDTLKSIQNSQYLFLGDYVDRGDYSTEVVLYLIAHKICYNNQFYLLRGNHETRLMCEYMTFFLECHNKYNKKVYEEFAQLFECLPLCALIEGNTNGRVLCMHGGISPLIQTIDQIQEINRFKEPDTNEPLSDILWSDPIDEYDKNDPQFKGMTKEDWRKIKFIDNTIRQTSYYYGRSALENFLKTNNLETIVRGHQVQSDGYMEHTFGCSDRPLPFCFTIFSAPNYCDQYDNTGALLSISNGPFDIKTFQCENHPFQLQDFQDGISFSLPYLIENFVNVLQELIIEIKDDVEDEEQKLEDQRLKEKCNKLFEKTKNMRIKQKIFREVLQDDYHKNMSKFKRMLDLDKQNEQYPTPDMVAIRQTNHSILLRRGATSPALLQRIERDSTFLNDRKSNVSSKSSINTNQKRIIDSQGKTLSKISSSNSIISNNSINNDSINNDSINNDSNNVQNNDNNSSAPRLKRQSSKTFIARSKR